MSSRYVKNEAGNYVCQTCNVVKTRANTMFYHMNKHDNNYPFECNVCKSKFMQKNSLELHMLARHATIEDNKNAYKCVFPNCQFKSLTKANRRIHSLRKHFKEELNEISGENFTCNACKSKYKSPEAFNYHAINCIKLNSENEKYRRDIL